MTSQSLCQDLVRNYLGALGQEAELENIPGGCLITTPFLMPDNDNIQLFARSRANGSVQLTDTGDTIRFLWINGLSLSRTTMGDIRRITKRYGVNLARNELVVDAEGDENPLHQLIQAVLGVSALIEKRRPHAKFNFDEFDNHRKSC